MSLPLSGCRVLDLGIVTAGAGAAAILADLGADVIKVEALDYQDPFRRWASASGEISPEASPFFRATNRNKRSLSLDLKRAEGRAVFLRLAASCDIVLENFSRGVLERLGIGFTTLRQANPDIILASISSQGETGCDAQHVSFGSTLDAMSGIAWLTGYAGEEPTITGRDVNYPDQVVTLFAAGMITTAIHARRNGGGAVHLDLSQRDLATFLCGDAFLDRSVAQRNGNHDPAYLVQDCFRAKDGRYVALSLEAARKDAIESLTGTPAAGVQAWIEQRDADAAVEALLSVGIAAAVVADGDDLARGEGELWSQALVATDEGMLVKGFPFQIRETPLRILRPLPALGIDGPEILRDIGGYGEADVADLIARGVIEMERAAPLSPDR